MLVLMNSNQYCILVICYANKTLQQYYPIQKLIPSTKTRKKISICPYYNKEKERASLEFELVLQRYLITFRNNSHNLKEKILIPRCFWNTKPKFTKESLFKNCSRKSESWAYVKWVYSLSIVRTKSVSPLWMNTHTPPKKNQTKPLILVTLKPSLNTEKERTNLI